ncbi:DUF2924 domain-containing protein [Erythrobacter sp. GH1-10]|uniref:DUF2924 domain-containing protein n=1 Tax=Erythrobacter sp. GH1-10 TaxID=3349334 RepID=UPI0038780941
MRSRPDRIADLMELSQSDLLDLWSDLFRQPVPSLPLNILRLLAAHRLQASRAGKLKVSVRRELERLAKDREGASAGKPASPRVSPGTRLVREWNGQTILVEVLEHGLRYDGKDWNSLTEIARAVTGTHWSGPRFFGLHKRG